MKLKRENNLIEVLFLLSCHKKFAGGYSSGKYVWPLNDDTYTYEIKDSSNGDYTQCGFNFDGSPPNGLSGVPLSLNGANYPFIDINIGNGNEFKSFSLAFFVKHEATSGCLLQFTKNSPSSSKLNDVRLCISGNNLILSWKFGNGAEDSLSLTFLPASTDWHLVILTRDYDTNSYDFKLQADGSSNSKTMTSSQSGVLGLPGGLRMGSLQDGSSTFTGKFTCIVMYDTFEVYLNEEGDIKQECQSYPSVSGLPSSYPGCAYQAAETTQGTTTLTQSWTTETEISTADSSTVLPTTTSIETTSTITDITTLQSSTTDTISTLADLPSTEYVVDCHKIPQAGTFYRILYNEKPNIQPLFTTNIKSSARCASICLRTALCRTYSTSRISFNTVRCSLFDTFKLGDATSYETVLKKKGNGSPARPPCTDPAEQTHKKATQK